MTGQSQQRYARYPCRLFCKMTICLIWTKIKYHYLIGVICSPQSVLAVIQVSLRMAIRIQPPTNMVILSNLSAIAATRCKDLKFARARLTDCGLERSQHVKVSPLVQLPLTRGKQLLETSALKCQNQVIPSASPALTSSWICSRYSHWFNSSATLVWCHIANLSASCQLGFLTCRVYLINANPNSNKNANSDVVECVTVVYTQTYR